jgi:TusE/DsrC/DsvC family sulfur relay protein
MQTIEYEGITIRLDDEGYLVDFDDWNEKVGCALADREGVSRECPLTTERMEILKFMRDYYQRFESFPILRAICKNVHQSKACTYENFPDPIIAWKIAGLPKPTTEVFAYIKHQK